MLCSPAPQPRSRSVRPRTSPSRARMKRFSGLVDPSKLAARSPTSTRVRAARASWKTRSRLTRSSAAIPGFEDPARELHLAQASRTRGGGIEVHVAGVSQPVERCLLGLLEDTPHVRADHGHAEEN